MARAGRRLGTGLPSTAARCSLVQDGGPRATTLNCVDESESPLCCVLTSLGVGRGIWNDLFSRVREWRLELPDRYGIPTDRELHACDLLAGRGKLVRQAGTDRRLAPKRGAVVFLGGLRVVEDAARSIGCVEVVNVCFPKPDVKGYERVSLDRL